MDDYSDDEAPMLVDLPGEGKVVPVTILTGFLGAGKTTLLNYLLTANHGKRLAVIENEFSAGMGIEGMIAKSGVDGANLEGFFELNNGCICCTIKDDLLTTLEQLVLHKERFDYVIIETTGVANPGPVINTFWSDDEIGSSLKLDGVVCVVDSAKVASYLETDDIANDVRMQISYADRVLLNKSDLLSEEERQAVKGTVTALNGMAEVVHTTFSKVSSDWVLDIDCYSTTLKDPTDLAFASRQGFIDNSICVPCAPAPAAAAAGTTVTNTTTNEADRSVFGAIVNKHSAQRLTTLPLVLGGEMDSKRLHSFLDTVLYVDNAATKKNSSSKGGGGGAHGSKGEGEGDGAGDSQQQGMALYRMKGVLHVRGSDVLHVLQAVHDTFDISPSSFLRGSADDSTGGSNKIIAIGRNIDAARLAEGFARCII